MGFGSQQTGYQSTSGICSLADHNYYYLEQIIIGQFIWEFSPCVKIDPLSCSQPLPSSANLKKMPLKLARKSKETFS